MHSRWLIYDPTSGIGLKILDAPEEIAEIQEGGYLPLPDGFDICTHYIDTATREVIERPDLPYSLEYTNDGIELTGLPEGTFVTVGENEIVVGSDEELTLEFEERGEYPLSITPPPPFRYIEREVVIDG